MIDLMDGYFAFAEIAKDAPPENRLAAFRSHVLHRDPAFTAAFLGFTKRIGPADADRMNPFFERMLELEPDIREYHALVRKSVPGVAREVAAHLDDRVYEVPLYIAVALFSSNGQVRFVGEQPAVMLGLDALAHDDAMIFSLDTPRDLRPLIAHEYFHAWHMTVNPFMAEVAERSLSTEPDAPVWATLWLEGLAACFSRITFPDANIHRVLSVEGIWDEAEPRLSSLASTLYSKLDSTDPTVIADWFYLSSTREDIPRKSAYILGVVAAHHVVAGIGLDAAARLEGGQLRRTVGDALADVADRGGDVSAAALCVPRLDRL